MKKYMGFFLGAVLLCAEPKSEAVLVDSINKKLDFVRFLLRELGLEAEVLTARAEELGRNPKYRETFDVVTARAVAQLNQLSEYCMPLVKVNGLFAPMKGKKLFEGVLVAYDENCVSVQEKDETIKFEKAKIAKICRAIDFDALLK